MSQLLTLTVASGASTWRTEAIERAHGRCESEEHAPDCRGFAEEVHHIVFKGQLGRKESHWIVENGLAVSRACHKLAHKTHNRSVPADRRTLAVDVVNVTENYKVPYFEYAA